MVSPTTKAYAGIDVSKGRLEVAVRPVGERFDVPNDDVPGSTSSSEDSGRGTPHWLSWSPPGA